VAGVSQVERVVISQTILIAVGEPKSIVTLIESDVCPFIIKQTAVLCFYCIDT